MHCPLGDDYFNVMSSMLTRGRDFAPVSASVVDRHILAAGSQSKVVSTIVRKDREDTPDLLVVTPTCTSSILQEDLNNYVQRAQAHAASNVIYAEVSHYRHSDIQAQDMILHQVTAKSLERARAEGIIDRRPTKRPSVNLIGVVDLAFHNRDDAREFRRLLAGIGVDVNLVYPKSARPDARPLLNAWVNVAPYRELGFLTVQYLRHTWGMPYVDVAPIGAGGIREFVLKLREALNEYVQDRVSEVQDVSPVDSSETLPSQASHNGDHCVSVVGKRWQEYLDYGERVISQAGWFSRSIDCQNLLGKRAVVFGDATHAASFTRFLSSELGVKVVCAGTYSKHDATWFRDRVAGHCAEVIITDDHTEVGRVISRTKPDAIFGTQMERHIGKKLVIPCGVISSPCHVQNFPLGYRPFIGYEGTNQLVDLVYNTFRLGMEDHLLEMFGGHDTESSVAAATPTTDVGIVWSQEAEQELRRAVPGFVQGRAKAFAENYAQQQNLLEVNIDTLYDAMEAHSQGKI